ncbi:MAG TPA: D-alanyl-lipoteichoic acid biosynthesis protein DltD [Burkholderiaceae bacterium]|nr:D-alanyl-lipoteichoic acid biosynthesis protein DltD [Burkholderiaceae bacterium]
MWRRILDTGLSRHLLAALTAVGIALLAYFGLNPYLTRAAHPRATDGLKIQAGVYLPNMGDNWNEQEVNFARMRQALADGTLVVMGSSELSSHDLRFVPYRFFPAELGVPTLAYGHAKLQTYGIFRVLQSLSAGFTPKTKLVIMLSPAWFADEGDMPSSAFAEHISGPVLDSLWGQPAAREGLIHWARTHETLGILGLLAQAKLAAFRDKLQMWLTGRPIASGPAYVQAPAALAATRDASFPVPGALPQADWPRLLSDARLKDQKLCGANRYLVCDHYYQKHISRVPDPAHQEFAHGNPLMAPEYADLSRLMAYLAEKKVHALFIMQPLNTKLVLDTKKFVPTVRSVMAMCRRYHMSCVNMYPLHQAPGIFKDDMHLAALGWALADEAIDRHFAQ